MPIPLTINIYERGAAGVPTTTLFDNLGPRANSYSHTITDQFGFESMQVELTVTLDEALDWLANGLMRSAIVYGPDPGIVWEGYLNAISAQIGQKVATISLDGLANRVRCVYTTVLGTPGVTSSVSDTTSQGLYGIKDRVVSLNSDTATAAANKAAIVLANLAYPKSNEATQAATGDQGGITLNLSFVGWYGTLGWVVFSRSSTTNTGISSQVGTLISGSTPGIGAINAFLSTSTLRLTTVSNTATEKVEAQTTYREKIETLLKQGTGTYPVAWGVYEGREFYIQTWAGATPTTITYREFLGDSNVYDIAGGIIAPWDVRPNAISQVDDFLDLGSYSTAPDAAARKYVGRVTCSISGNQAGCTLEPSELSNIETRLATLR